MDFAKFVNESYWPDTMNAASTKTIWELIFQFYDNGYFAALQLGQLTKSIMKARRADYARCFRKIIEASCILAEGKARKRKRLHDETVARETAFRALRAAAGAPRTP